MSNENHDASERLAALEADNRRLRGLLGIAGRMAEVGRFAARQTHELRQPLFAIKGLAQLLLDREVVDAQEVRDYARHIVEQSDRLAGLVADLRHLSLPGVEPVKGDASTEVAPVLSRVAALLDWRLRRGVSLRTDIAPEVPPVAMTRGQLEQILINLISNALDAVAGRPHPTIQIRVSVRSRVADSPGVVDILVADNGSGVPPSTRVRLFETFFTTKGEEAGTGLGLAVSREIAQGADGELLLLDQPGVWKDPAVTCFRLTLPVAAEPAA